MLWDTSARKGQALSIPTPAQAQACFLLTGAISYHSPASRVKAKEQSGAMSGATYTWADLGESTRNTVSSDFFQAE